jgi:hypothetical protein
MGNPKEHTKQADAAGVDHRNRLAAAPNRWLARISLTVLHRVGSVLAVGSFVFELAL